ncbi:MAG: methyl-accepting chemotaxis protein [Methylocystaceae bacterium]
MKSVGTRLTVMVSLVVLFVCAALSAVSYQTASNSLIANVEETLPEKATDCSKLIARSIQVHMAAIEGVAAQPEICSMIWEQQQPVLNFENQRLGYQNLGVATLDGMLHYPDGSTAYIGNKDYFKAAVSGKSVMSDPMIGLTTGKLSCMALVPIKGNSTVLGVLVATMDDQALSKIVKEIKYGKSGYAFVINKLGTTVAHPDHKLVINQDNDFNNVKKDPQLKPLVVLESRMVKGEKGVGSYSYNGVEKYMGFAPIEGTDWSVAVVAPKAEVLAGMGKLRTRTILVTLILILLGMGLGWFIGRQLGKPIHRAADLAHKVANGDLTQDVDDKFLKRQDEVGMLARSIETMMKNLRSIVGQIDQGSSQINQAAKRLSASAQDVASTMQQISASTEEIAAGLQEVSASTEEINAAQEEVEASLNQLAYEAEGGKKRAIKIDTKASEMQLSAQQSRNLANTMYEEIQEKMKRAIAEARIVNEITSLAMTIAGIADQTNLLALNAAIEAARAGEQGRGFAVVADEVRKLAEETSETVHNIQELTKQVERSIGQLVQNSDVMLDFINNTVINDYEKLVSIGEQYKNDADMVLGLTSRVGDMTQQVLASVGETTKAIETIATTMQQSASGAQEIARGTESANQQMEVTNRLVEQQKEAADQLAVVLTQVRI